ncbi:hypothetical protein XELAEV_18007243mg [Xenopus laevis]|uniref:Ig-like domain-containing protein n=1 Tax=Xenopus laevis TaxID=8355 RepID=A0A974E2M5_XENLA|nr:hypothetical protein XELAEV_18007243mg [Xenopus laevis]
MQMVIFWMFMQTMSFYYVSCKEEVTQLPRSASAQGGGMFNMTCEYTTTFYGLQWYKQVPGERLQHLTILRKDEEITQDRFVFQLQKEKQLSTLSIKHVEVSDSATYWCALEAQY